MVDHTRFLYTVRPYVCETVQIIIAKKEVGFGVHTVAMCVYGPQLCRVYILLSLTITIACLFILRASIRTS